MTELPKMFRHDHVLRDKKGVPLARVILVDDNAYEEGEPIAVALLSAPVATVRKVLGRTFYADGIEYRIPPDIAPLKMKERGGKHLVNNFYLQPVGP